MTGVRPRSLGSAPVAFAPPRPSRDHRSLGPSLGLWSLQDGGFHWTSLGERLRATVCDLVRSTFGSEGLTFEPVGGMVPPYGLLGHDGVQPRVVRPADQARSLADGLVRFVRRLELEPSRPEWTEEGFRLHTLDRLGRAWPGAAVVADGPRVVVHACASVEQLLVALIEQGGPWPFAVAPEQVRVLPIGEGQRPYAAALTGKLRRAGVRCAPQACQGSLPARIRGAAAARVPVIAVVGPREVEQRTVSIRGGATETEAAFVERLSNPFTGDATPSRPASSTRAPETVAARASTAPDRQEEYHP